MSKTKRELLTKVFKTAGLSDKEIKLLLAGVKWSDDAVFIPNNSLDGTELLVGLKSGNNFKTNLANGILVFAQANLKSAANVITIAENGVDAPGNGGDLNPYISLDYALSQISDHSVVTLVNVYNAQTILSLVSYPNVLIELHGNPLTVTDSVILHSSWSSGGIFSLNGSGNLNLPVGVSLDFDDIGAGAAFFYLTNNITSSNTSFNFNGSTSGNTTLFIDGNSFIGMPFSYYITNCYGSISRDSVYASQSINSNNSVGNEFTFENVRFLNNFLALCSSNAFTLNQKNCTFLGTSEYQSTSTGVLTVLGEGNIYFTPPLLDNGTSGGVVNFEEPTLAALPTLLNGATYTPSTIANSILTNYIPLNFTPTNVSLEGAIEGIDNALAGGGGGGSNAAFSAYLSSGQNNVTGDGTIYTLVCDAQDTLSPQYNASTGVFTADKTGYYQFSASVNLFNLDPAMTSMKLWLFTTLNNYVIDGNNPFAGKDDAGDFTSIGSATVFMNAGDTAYIGVEVDGGLLQVGVYSSVNPIFAFFGGSYVGPTLGSGGGDFQDTYDAGTTPAKGKVTLTDDNNNPVVIEATYVGGFQNGLKIRNALDPNSNTIFPTIVGHTFFNKALTEVYSYRVRATVQSTNAGAERSSVIFDAIYNGVQKAFAMYSSVDDLFSVYKNGGFSPVVTENDNVDLYISSGDATLSGGSAFVSLPSLAAGQRILLSYKAVGSNPGSVYVSVRNNGSGFTITSTSFLDTSTIHWEIY